MTGGFDGLSVEAVQAFNAIYPVVQRVVGVRSLVSGKEALLVWVGGDVSSYVKVRYRIEGGEYETFVSTAAIHEHLLRQGFRVKPVLLVPETLFAKDGCRCYIAILDCKASKGACRLIAEKGRELKELNVYEDPCVKKLVESLRECGECYEIPHPGFASPLGLRVYEEKVRTVVLRREASRFFETLEPSVYLDFIYEKLSKAAESMNTLDLIVVDATHGSNLAVLYTVLAATILARAKGVQLRVYSAPILGPVSEGVNVDVVDVSGVYSISLKLFSGLDALHRLDERLLEPLVKGYVDVGRRFGPQLKQHYGLGKILLKQSMETLWAFRSGQIPLIPEQIQKLHRILDEINDTLKILRESYLGDLSKAREYSKHGPATPLYTLLETVTQAMRTRIVNDLVGRNQLEALQVALEKILGEYPDRVLSVAREYIVLLYILQLLQGILKRGEKYTIKVGDKLWQCVDDMLKAFKAETFEKARQLRNKLMHGRISKEDGTQIEVEVYEKGVKTRIHVGEGIIRYQKVYEEAKKLLEVSRGILKKLCTKA